MKHRTDAATCPRCERFLDGATAADDNAHAPQHGDLSICIYCGAPLRFVQRGERLDLEIASSDEAAEILQAFKR